MEGGIGGHGANDIDGNYGAGGVKAEITDT